MAEETSTSESAESSEGKNEGVTTGDNATANAGGNDTSTETNTAGDDSSTSSNVDNKGTQMSLEDIQGLNQTLQGLNETLTKAGDDVKANKTQKKEAELEAERKRNEALTNMIVKQAESLIGNFPDEQQSVLKEMRDNFKDPIQWVEQVAKFAKVFSPVNTENKPKSGANTPGSTTKKDGGMSDPEYGVSKPHELTPKTRERLEMLGGYKFAKKIDSIMPSIHSEVMSRDGTVRYRPKDFRAFVEMMNRRE